jgi:hypothetical protein
MIAPGADGVGYAFVRRPPVARGRTKLNHASRKSSGIYFRYVELSGVLAAPRIEDVTAIVFHTDAPFTATLKAVPCICQSSAEANFGIQQKQLHRCRSSSQNRMSCKAEPKCPGAIR